MTNRGWGGARIATATKSIGLARGAYGIDSRSSFCFVR